MYIHCANGHGRSTSLAALVLVYRGEFRTWREAFAHIQQHRRLAKIHSNQELVMDEAQRLLDEIDEWEQQEDSAGVVADLSGDGVGGVVRQSSVQKRLFKYVRAASDGGIMEVKPSAPQDRPIVEHYNRTGRAIASRKELENAPPVAEDNAGAPKISATRPPPGTHTGALADADASHVAPSPLPEGEFASVVPDLSPGTPRGQGDPQAAVAAPPAESEHVGGERDETGPR